MSLPRRDIVPEDPARNVAEEDPPSRPGTQYQPPQVSMDGSQLVQWLSVQAGNMAGDLQHNVRALMVRTTSPMPVLDGRDEVSSLRQQLRHQQQAHKELQTMLRNQALAIETFQSKWQMAGQEARAFIARTRSQSEDFVRAELTAVQRFENSLQRQYDGQLRSHVSALQDEAPACPRPGIQCVSRPTATGLKTSCVSGGVCRCSSPSRSGAGETADFTAG